MKSDSVTASVFAVVKKRHLARFIIYCLGYLLLSSCTSTEVTNRDRTAVEQLLLSTAADNALAAVSLPEISGETVYVDGSYLDSYDERYVLGSIRALLSRNGALLQNNRAAADVIVEPRSGALGIDESESLLGVPSLPFGFPGVAGLETPELALFSSDKGDAVSKIALLGYRSDGTPLFARDSLIGSSHFYQYKILFFINLNLTDIPAREGY